MIAPTETRVTDTLLDLLVNEGQPEVARALLPVSLTAASASMRGRLEAAGSGCWPPGVYVPVVVRLSRFGDGPVAVLLSRVTERALSPSEGLAVAEDRYAAECFSRLTGDAPSGRPRVLEHGGRRCLEFEDLRSARAALVLARLIARHGVTLRGPVIVTGDVADPSGFHGADLEVEPVDGETVGLKVVAAAAIPGAQVFVPERQGGVAGRSTGVRRVSTVDGLYRAVSGGGLPALPEEAIEREARRLKAALRSGNVTEETAGRIAVSASELLVTLARAACTDRPLVGRLRGIEALGHSRSGRTEAMEATLSEALADPEVDDPDVRCMLTNVLALGLSDRGAHHQGIEAIADLRRALEATGRFANDAEMHDLCGTEILVRSLRALTSREYDPAVRGLLDTYRAHGAPDPGRVATYESLVHHVLSDDPDQDPAFDSIFGSALSSRDTAPLRGPTIYAFVHRLGVLGRGRHYARVLTEYNAWLGDPGQSELEEHLTEGVGVLWQVVRAMTALGADGSAALLERARGERAGLMRRVEAIGSAHARARLAACDLLLDAVAGGADRGRLLLNLSDAHDPRSRVARAAGALIEEHAALSPGEYRGRVDALLDLLA